MPIETLPDSQPSKHFDVAGLSFFDLSSGRQMKYVYPDTAHWSAGWILYRHVDGGWVTLRKATDADISAINGAVVTAHHRGEATDATR